jgi:hypothetical protein
MVGGQNLRHQVISEKEVLKDGKMDTVLDT